MVIGKPSLTKTNNRKKQADRLTAHNRVMPVLLDRLTDEQPQKDKEPPIQSSISHQALRKMVLRDLQWLFNCINAESSLDFSTYPALKKTTINYGIPALAGQRMSEIEWEDIQQALTDAILNFEPRILAEGLSVTCLTDTNSLDTYNVLSIQIKGKLWCIPHPMEFLFRSDIDLENGNFDLKDVS